MAQDKVLKVIRKSIAKTGKGPKIGEIVKSTNLNINTVSRRIKQLRTAGVIMMNPRDYESIRIVGEGDKNVPAKDSSLANKPIGEIITTLTAERDRLNEQIAALEKMRTGAP